MMAWTAGPRYDRKMTNDTWPDGPTALYGKPAEDLVELSGVPLQLSPWIPGSAALETVEDESLAHAVIVAPPGTIERRFVLAHALRSLRQGGRLTALAPKDKGGSRLGQELEGFGCEAQSRSRSHLRILDARRPAAATGLGEAIAAGAPVFDEATALWTQAGIFSFDRIDPGSRLLVEHLPALSGRGADLGCGLGVIGRAVLQSSKVAELASIDLDRRAVEAARRNIADERARFLWADLRDPQPALSRLDFVVSNPPFHDGGAEDKLLGQTFIRRAAEMLRKGGSAHIVANRHLPYEAVLGQVFSRVAVVAQTGGYKLFEARR